jgi:predicted enzyme related to lactoylglutathione lyase
MRQYVNYLDHLAFLVLPENLEKYKTLLTNTLGARWDATVTNESAGVSATPAWDAGLELIAPLRPSGTIWERIQRWGEGTVTIVFGTRDLKKAVAQATANGGEFLYDVVMNGDEWPDRFETFKESKVQIFPKDFASTVTLSEIVPRHSEGVVGDGVLRQHVNRLDHIAIVVKNENMARYQQLLTDTLGVTWEQPIANESAGVVAVNSWDSGLEFIAPLRPSGRVWERLQKFGEGTITMVFGVPDIKKGVQRVVENGGAHLFDIALEGTEPWRTRFTDWHEAKVQIFDDAFATTVTLSQIVPVEVKTPERA